MIKILFYIDTLSGGGAEKVLCNLVNNMDQSKFDITVQTTEACDHQKYLVDGIHYRAINRCKTKLGQKLFSYWFRLCAELKLAYPLFVKGNYDIEVAYLETGATKIIAQSTNQKAVKLAWVHCDLSQKAGFKEKREKLASQYQKFSRVICVSNDSKKSFDSLFGDCTASIVLYNVIDESEILEKASKPLPIVQDDNIKKLLAVGRLSKEKAFDRLIEACMQLKRDGYQFCLNILGDGPEHRSLEKLIQDNSLEDVIELVGFTENPYPYMKASDCIVCSSKTEALSTVILESLILGKAIITTPCAGMQELLGDSEFGLIAEDTETGLYDSIRKMLDSDELVNRYALAARKRGTDFFKEKVLQETQSFFERELANRQ